MFRSFAQELNKLAQLRKGVQLRPHQQEAVDTVEENQGRALLAHGTGTGKTLAAIAAVEHLRNRGKANRALVVVPAALQDNFANKGVKTYSHSSVGEVGSGSDYEIVSMEKFRRNPEQSIRQSKADTLVVDEIHKAKDPQSLTYRSLRQVSPRVKNLIGLTGSFISNHPKEIVPLMDIVHPGHRVGSVSGFKQKFTKSEVISGGGFLRKPKKRTALKSKPELGKRLAGRLHYLGHEAVSSEMPKVRVKEVHTPMTTGQHKLYEFALGRLDPVTRAAIRQGLPVNQSEASHIFSAIAKARQASNSIGAHVDIPLHEAAEKTPKLKKMMDDVEQHLKRTPDGQAVVYTNLVRGGADAIYSGLARRKLNPGMYAGIGALEGVTSKTRQKDLDDFVAGKKKVMVLTPAGGEGVSLNNATFFAEVDRHYNPERNQQAIARGRRLGGQAHRPPDKRVLEVRRYYSDPPKSLISKILGNREVGVDEWIGNVAHEKDRLNEEMRSVVRRKG